MKNLTALVAALTIALSGVVVVGLVNPADVVASTNPVAGSIA